MKNKNRKSFGDWIEDNEAFGLIIGFVGIIAIVTGILLGVLL